MYSTRSIRSLAELYEESFVRISEHPVPKTKELEESFSVMLDDIKETHRMVQANIANGFMEMTRLGVPKKFVQHEDVQSILSRFYTGRIGIRLLIEQHLALRHDSEEKLKSPGGAAGNSAFVGCIMTNCSIYDVLVPPLLCCAVLC
jgi:hypothetical protein